jgi:hypothetical protein
MLRLYPTYLTQNLYLSNKFSPKENTNINTDYDDANVSIL